MILSRTPFRSSFFGGGSDLPAFYEGGDCGAVLSAALNKYMYVSVHPFFNRKKYQLKYSKTELADSVDEIRHPLVREAVRLMGFEGGLEISSNADIPAGTGLGSSSSFTVGLLQALHAFKGKFISKTELADMACKVEIDLVGDPIGKQDQYAAAHGGLNVFEFHPDGQVDATPMHLANKTVKVLEENTLMFYTRINRPAGEILSHQAREYENEKKRGIMKEMVEQVYTARDLLYNDDLSGFGELLDEAWQLKSKISEKITSPEIDNAYQAGKKAGALGGKLLGAGGGGFLLFYCEPGKQDDLRAALSKYFELHVKFDWHGSKIVYVGEKDWEDNYGFFE